MSKYEAKLFKLSICLIIVHLIAIGVGMHDTYHGSMGFSIGTLIASIGLFFGTNLLDEIEDKRNAD